MLRTVFGGVVIELWELQKQALLDTRARQLRSASTGQQLHKLGTRHVHNPLPGKDGLKGERGDVICQRLWYPGRIAVSS